MHGNGIVNLIVICVCVHARMWMEAIFGSPMLDYFLHVQMFWTNYCWIYDLTEVIILYSVFSKICLSTFFFCYCKLEEEKIYWICILKYFRIEQSEIDVTSGFFVLFDQASVFVFSLFYFNKVNKDLWWRHDHLLGLSAICSCNINFCSI